MNFALINVILKFRSRWIPLHHCREIREDVSGDLELKFLDNSTIYFYQDGADYFYLKFWLEFYEGEFKGQLINVEKFYEQHKHEYDPEGLYAAKLQYFDSI